MNINSEKDMEAYISGLNKGRAYNFDPRMYRPAMHSLEFNTGVHDGLKSTQRKEIPQLELYLLIEEGK